MDPLYLVITMTVLRIMLLCLYVIRFCKHRPLSLMISMMIGATHATFREVREFFTARACGLISPSPATAIPMLPPPPTLTDDTLPPIVTQALARVALAPTLPVPAPVPMDTRVHPVVQPQPHKGKR